ncbi:hypothetical protein Ahy_B08g091764 [Arachis hypogaea]|uniref:aminobutyraldehyde dehydrogenase n=1 Tax=Arachis hypogaea TaxID=3818 RepID=A0A444Y2L7_ARAHY|nr:hypothetical protein Ahy_B08g091764 [Arachis hypogaea]
MEVAFPSSALLVSALLPLNAYFDCSVAAARRALNCNKGNDWPSASGAHQARYLCAIDAKVVERKDHLAKLESLDCGKPLDEAAWDMDDVAGCFEFYADLAEKLEAKQKAPVSLPMETFKREIHDSLICVIIRLVLLWTLDPAERDAFLANEATKRWTSSNQFLMKIACTRKAYHARYKKSLEEDVAHHTTGSSVSFMVIHIGGETNLKFIYCAAACFHGGRDDPIPSPFHPLTDGSTQPIIHGESQPNGNSHKSTNPFDFLDDADVSDVEHGNMEAVKHFGPAPGVPHSHTKLYVRSKERKFERARGRMNNKELRV